MRRPSRSEQPGASDRRGRGYRCGGQPDELGDHDVLGVGGVLDAVVDVLGLLLRPHRTVVCA
jgi:hypothetical protein